MTKSHLTSVPTHNPKDLPKELQEQLSTNYLKGNNPSQVEGRILKLLIGKIDGLSVDEIIVNYYHAYDNDILKRVNVNNRLAKMISDSESKIVKVKQGVYKLKKQSILDEK